MKGVIRYEMHFYMLFEHKCVLAVCVHNHPIMIKINPVFFLYLLKSLPLSQIEPISDAVAQTGPSHDSWLTVTFQHRLDWCLTLDPPWVICHQSGIVSPPEQMSPKQCLPKRVLLLDVMNIAVVIYSWHLSCWRRSGLRFFLKGMRPSICLNVSMFARIIWDPASPPEVSSILFFNESLQITFTTNVLVSKFHNECS